ncbi:hypothetical protein D3C80_2149560 [compost metagenome]
MCCRIDPARKAGDYCEASVTQITRQTLCEACADHRRIARADNSHWWLAKHIGVALDDHKRRRCLAVF